jgi:flagellar protein FliO/FliZ
MNSLSIPRALGAAVSCCLLLPAASLAADGEKTPLDLAGSGAETARASSAASGGGLVRTIVGLAVVLGVIYGLHWILKQVKASREEQGSGAGLGSLATLPLGPNRSLHLVRAGSELVLVGVGEGGVTPIRTYSEDEARDLGLLGDEDEDPGEAPARRAPGRRPELGGMVGRMVSDLRERTVIR